MGVSWSIWNVDSADRKKEKITGLLPFFSAQYCSWDMGWNTTEQFNFSFSAFERCLESAWVLSLSKMNDFPSWKYIVYWPWILHNIKMSCYRKLSETSKKKCRLLQFKIVPVVIIVINCTATSGLWTTRWQSEDFKQGEAINPAKVSKDASGVLLPEKHQRQVYSKSQKQIHCFMVSHVADFLWLGK